ncbi:hypothetical protein GJ496_005996 [Pomphorhynchus laevis]|nr:hypothetical protein GJ496_005996 [Pomphorhynchus laevis]
MAPKQIHVCVLTMDAELDFSISPSSNGKLLFDQVIKTIGLREFWWFGLQFTDSKDMIAWIRPNKKVLQEDIKKPVGDQPIFLKLRAKFYPEDIGEEIIQDITLKLFFLQVKEQILLEEIYCPPETCVLLSSYAMQARFGDFTSSKSYNILANENLLPNRVKAQHNLSEREWHDKIAKWWQEHQGLAKEDAMLEYLKISQDLEMYGVNYFPIMNKKKTNIYLGVDALGLNVYDKTDKIVPKIGFPWSEIRNIAFNDRKFIIKPIEKKAKEFTFYVPRLRVNKRILALCMGNHEMYMRRRRPETADVQQMKAQAKEERKIRKDERERMLQEMERREQAERERNEMLERVRIMERDAEKIKLELQKRADLEKELEQKLKEADIARQAVEIEKNQSEALQRQLKEQAKMQQEERDKITQEIVHLQSLISQKDLDANEKAKRAEMLENQLKQSTNTTTSLYVLPNISSHVYNDAHANAPSSSTKYVTKFGPDKSILKLSQVEMNNTNGHNYNAMVEDDEDRFSQMGQSFCLS